MIYFIRWATLGAITVEICIKVRGKKLTSTSLDRWEQVLETVLGDSVRHGVLQNVGHQHLCKCCRQKKIDEMTFTESQDAEFIATVMKECDRLKTKNAAMQDGSSHNAEKMLAETRRLKYQCEQTMQRADVETKEKEKIQCQKEAIKKVTNRNSRNACGESGSWKSPSRQVMLTTPNCLPRQWNGVQSFRSI